MWCPNLGSRPNSRYDGQEQDLESTPGYTGPYYWFQITFCICELKIVKPCKNSVMGCTRWRLSNFDLQVERILNLMLLSKTISWPAWQLKVINSVIAMRGNCDRNQLWNHLDPVSCGANWIMIWCRYHELDYVIFGCIRHFLRVSSS